MAIVLLQHDSASMLLQHDSETASDPSLQGLEKVIEFSWHGSKVAIVLSQYLG